ncbi:MAG: phosphoadenosine phosphosulfate reductase [Bryobacterales bacterium]|nr:phosphoadenosine phosphosulfate reductase [Bryobacterales bacterium]
MPLVVADGLGVNSTALLIQLQHVGVRPDLILFADTGSEKHDTYEYVQTRREWLRAAGFPDLIVVRRRGVRVPDRSLEDQCLRTGTLPSLAYGGKSCSLKWKVAPQNKFCNHWEPALKCWRSGRKVIKVIGYDAGPSDGRRVKAFRDPKYLFWYPLREFGLDRAACVDLIRSEKLPVPAKSACFFCPATKKPELVQLQIRYPDLVKRAIAIEQRAKPKLRSVKGLGRNFAWAEWLDQQFEIERAFKSALTAGPQFALCFHADSPVSQRA